MSIDDLTIGEAKELIGMFGTIQTAREEEVYPFKVGKNYIIRTVTFTYTGRLTKVYDKELVFEDVAWIADTGRWADALKDINNLNEVEPYPSGEVILGRGAILDMFKIKDDLPRSQK